MSANLIGIGRRETSWHGLDDEVVIGKDILELLSSSMYVDPMTIYREYVQNAADAIDDARATGVLEPTQGTVDIRIDPAARVVTITDDGAGIPSEEFTRRLAAFGGSTKRGRGARGFRGVGRLAGIGYCQELVFRSRSLGEAHVNELRWDCRKLKSILRSTERDTDLARAVAEVVTVRRIPADGDPGRFFAVELHGIVRHRNDQLLSTVAVSDYLRQVSPVPFHPDFPYGGEIVAHLNGHVRLGNIRLTVNGGEPVFRPHRAAVAVSEIVRDPFTEIQFVTVPGLDGGTAAVGWVAHHAYRGALPADCGVRGLRMRVGNIQVGDERLLEELFPEARFNLWSVGEVHVLDQRVVPNGRRDHFEQNVHYHNVLTHLLPAAREVSQRCRISSVRRKHFRDFEIAAITVREKLGILKQSAVAPADRKRLAEDIRAGVAALGQITNRGMLPVEAALELRKQVEKLEREVQRILTSCAAPSPLAALPAAKRRVYEHVIGLIYECSPNQAAAKLLVDKILIRIS